MAKKKQKSALGYICLALVAICAIIAVVGATQDWTVATFGGEVVKGSGSTLENYKEAGDMAADLGVEDNTSRTIAALGYLAVAAICVVAVAYVVKQLISLTLFRIIVILAGVATMAIGVAAIAYQPYAVPYNSDTGGRCDHGDRRCRNSLSALRCSV